MIRKSKSETDLLGCTRRPSCVLMGGARASQGTASEPCLPLLLSRKAGATLWHRMNRRQQHYYPKHRPRVSPQPMLTEKQLAMTTTTMTMSAYDDAPASSAHEDCESELQNSESCVGELVQLLLLLPTKSRPG